MSIRLTFVIGGFGCLASAALAGSYEAKVKSYAMTAPDNLVEGAKAVLMTSDAGIAGRLDTNGLMPGHVYTMWIAIVNKPDVCEMKEADRCTGSDVIGRVEEVMSDVTIGDGVVAGEDGTATFRTFVPAGDVGRSWMDVGLINPTGAEIHFALHDHGPVIADRLAEMLGTAREGCLEDSLPKGWPASARAWGDAGPNTCAMVQFAVFKQE